MNFTTLKRYFNKYGMSISLHGLLLSFTTAEASKSPSEHIREACDPHFSLIPGMGVNPYKTSSPNLFLVGEWHSDKKSLSDCVQSIIETRPDVSNVDVYVEGIDSGTAKECHEMPGYAFSKNLKFLETKRADRNRPKPKVMCQGWDHHKSVVAAEKLAYGHSAIFLTTARALYDRHYIPANKNDRYFQEKLPELEKNILEIIKKESDRKSGLEKNPQIKENIQKEARGISEETKKLFNFLKTEKRKHKNTSYDTIFNSIFELQKKQKFTEHEIEESAEYSRLHEIREKSCIKAIEKRNKKNLSIFIIGSEHLSHPERIIPTTLKEFEHENPYALLVYDREKNSTPRNEF